MDRKHDFDTDEKVSDESKMKPRLHAVGTLITFEGINRVGSEAL